MIKMDYEVYSMKNITEKDYSEKSDVFICFDTHEDRAFNALNHLCKNKLINDALILFFSSVGESTSVSKYNIKIEKYALNRDINSELIPCLRVIDKFVAEKNIISIDISCMPIPFIAQILHFLYSYHGGKVLKIYYTEPSLYTLQNLFDYTAFEGEIDLTTIKGFEGRTSQLDITKRVLFYLMGFELKTLYKRILQDVAPDKTAPINGFPAYFPKYKDISLINNDYNFHEENIEIVYAEANNPFEVYNTLATLGEKYKDCCVDIIPVGTKPMALGACLYALKKGVCRMIFPFPSEYKPKQNKGCGKLWEYSMEISI
jgi:hypothetical protein